MLEYTFEGRESPACANDLKSMPGYGKICSEILVALTSRVLQMLCSTTWKEDKGSKTN